MTSPQIVDSIGVEILADAKALAKSMKAEVEKAFRDLDPGKATERASRKNPVKVPLEPDADGLGEKVKEETRKTKAPRVPVGLDPLLAEFQAEVRRQVKGLARTINAEVPVGADTSELRRELAAELARVTQQSRARIPVEVADQERYETDLRATVARAAERVREAATRARVRIPVEVDVDRGGALARLRSLFSGLGGAGQGALAGLTAGIERAAQSAITLGGNLLGAGNAALGPLGTVISLLGLAVAGMAALAAAAVAAVPAITAVAGAAAAIPGALAGAGAVFGTLALGFSGLSDAFKPKAGGGGGGGGGAAGQGRQLAAAARQVEAARRGIAAANRQVEASERALAAAHRGVEAAEERLVEAQRRALTAQQAVARARIDAVEDIEDLNRALRGAQLSEEDAALGVEEALRALNEVKLTGNIPDIRRADLAYRQALQTLEESQDTRDDLAKETDEANKKGVEGSERVQDALQDERDALKAVRDAQIGVIEANDSLKSAQDGVAAAMDGVKSAADSLKSAQESLNQAQTGTAAGAGGVAREVTKLAPAAQAFVSAIKGLKPQFEALRLDVQQRLFAGLAKTITDVARAWDQPLHRILGSYATTFNGFFKDLGASVSTPEFIADMEIGLEGFRRGMDGLLDAIAQDLVPAFGDLTEAAAPFLEKLLGGLGRVVTKFSDWVEAGEKSGALTDFFDRATAALGEIGRLGGATVRIIGNIIEIITGAQSKDSSQSPLEAFRRGLDRVADWLDNPTNQEQIRAWIKDIGDMAVEFGRAATSVNNFLRDIGITGAGEGGSAGDAIGRALVSGIIAGAGELMAASAKSFIDNVFMFGLIGQLKKGLGIKSPSTVTAEIGRDLVRGLINGVTGWLTNLRTTVIRIRTTITTALANAGTWLVNTGRSAVSGLGSGIAQLGSWLRDRALSLKTRITNALSNAITLLRASGQNVVIGLWNGISSLGGWLWDRVVSFAQRYVTNPINAALGINSPSKVAAKLGESVPEGLALGIDREAGQAAAAAERLAAAALPQIQDVSMGLGWEADAAIRGSLAVADQRDMMLSWKTGATGDQILDAIARVVDVRFNSNVDAAFTRTRR